MYRSIFEICILFFPQKQSRFSFKPPFSRRCRGKPCLPSYTASAPTYRIIFRSAPSPLRRIPYLPATLVPYRNPPRRARSPALHAALPWDVGAHSVRPQRKPLPRFSGKVPHAETDFLSKKILPAAHPPLGTTSPLLNRLIFMKKSLFPAISSRKPTFFPPKTDFLSAHFYETMSVIR